MLVACLVSKPTRSLAPAHAHAFGRPHAHADMYYLLLFHYNSGYANAPQCYVIRTLSVLLLLVLYNCNIVLVLYYALFWWHIVITNCMEQSSQLLKKLPAICETRRFITTLTRARRLSISFETFLFYHWLLTYWHVVILSFTVDILAYWDIAILPFTVDILAYCHFTIYCWHIGIL